MAVHHTLAGEGIETGKTQGAVSSCDDGAAMHVAHVAVVDARLINFNVSTHMSPRVHQTTVWHAVTVEIVHMVKLCKKVLSMHV